jgi:hypothetical protein
MGNMPMPGQTWLDALASFVGMRLVMMVAMLHHHDNPDRDRSNSRQRRPLHFDLGLYGDPPRHQAVGKAGDARITRRIVRNGASGSSRHTHVPDCALNARIGKLSQ